jgi:prepilin-type N-terminal cleavage/methylation domain-containing protein
MDEGLLMRSRAGFTLIEMIVALTVLSFVILGAQSMATTMIRTVSTANAQASAAQLVEDRIDRIRTDPAYDSLTLKYVGTETTLPGWSTFQRVTQMSWTYDSTAVGITNYITVTVTVSGQGLPGPIRRTVVVSP